MRKEKIKKKTVQKRRNKKKCEKQKKLKQKVDRILYHSVSYDHPRCITVRWIQSHGMTGIQYQSLIVMHNR